VLEKAQAWLLLVGYQLRLQEPDSQQLRVIMHDIGTLNLKVRLAAAATATGTDGLPACSCVRSMIYFDLTQQWGRGSACLFTLLM